MKNLILLFSFALFSCTAQLNEQATQSSEPETNLQKATIVETYYTLHVNDSTASDSKGSVSHGTLENGSLLPFSGKNYRYFDIASYLGGRAFANCKLISTLENTYSALDKLHPGRQFVLMECSNEHGGKMHPHRTHQNGLSTDFMIPLMKNKQPYYGLDSLGATHYLLDFDDAGNYTKDSTIKIDFELLAQFILTLEEQAKRSGLKINKIILKLELKDELFASTTGKQLSKSGIYFARNLDPLINSLHDDHFHVDFAVIE